jgi:hypothetical protein
MRAEFSTPGAYSSDARCRMPSGSPVAVFSRACQSRNLFSMPVKRKRVDVRSKLGSRSSLTYSSACEPGEVGLKI